MADSKHTPGPWKVNAYGEIADRENNPIAEILYRSLERTPEALAEEAANLQVIVAAPEMLATLKKLVWLETSQGVNDEELEDAIQEATTVIAKATGATELTAA